MTLFKESAQMMFFEVEMSLLPTSRAVADPGFLFKGGRPKQAVGFCGLHRILISVFMQVLEVDPSPAGVLVCKWMWGVKWLDDMDQRKWHLYLNRMLDLDPEHCI